MKHILIIVSIFFLGSCTFPVDTPTITNTSIDTTIPPHDGFTQIWQSEFSESTRHSRPVIFENRVIALESENISRSCYAIHI